MIHSIQGFTQESDYIRVSGNVFYQENITLPGVNIKLKGTYQGTISDANGHYELEVPENCVLIYSHIGFETIEIKISGRESVDVRMIPIPAWMEEIVVVGYGQEKSERVTGSVGSLESEEFSHGIISNPAELIQG